MPTVVTDPPVSENQRRAMWAAASGHSTIGIPKKVGKEFVGKDSKPFHSAGVMFITKDGKILFIKRTKVNVTGVGTWGIPGGKQDEGDDNLVATAYRETEEEIGFIPEGLRMSKAAIMEYDDFDFTTYFCIVPEPFIPKLNQEHSGYAWVDPHYPPEPIHPGCQAVLEAMLNPEQASDMSPRDWAGVLKFLEEEMEEENHQEVGDALPEILAMDRGTLRSYDRDGRMHVAISHISKANVCPYRGKEIPNGKALGLDPDRLYKILRDPEELKKGAHTFNNLPILDQHVGVTADSPRQDLIIGSTGTDAIFDEPYLDNSLVFWVKEAIEDIENDVRTELSCSYRFTPDMSPGTYKGERYDGRMVDIIGNHVCLVRKGRAGSDVLVGDEDISTTKEIIVMPKKTGTAILSRKAALAKGALLVLLGPMLVSDAALDLDPALKGVNNKNFKDKKPDIMKGLAEALKGKLVNDSAYVGPVNDLLQKLAEVDEPEGLAMDEGKEEEKGHAFLKSKLSAEDMATYDSMCATTMGAKDEKEVKDKKEEEEEKEAKDTDEGDEAKDEKDKEEEKVDKKAMDAAIDAAVKNERKQQRAVREALAEVAPYVGELSGVVCDSAEEVYKHTLDALQIDVKGVHPSAYAAIIRAQTPPTKRTKEPKLAMDAAINEGISKRFPHAATIRVLG